MKSGFGKLLAVLFLLICLPGTAFSHAFWINVFAGDNKLPRHILTSLGWGHHIPFDDSLNTQKGKVLLQDFHLVCPNGTRTPLKFPKPDTDEPFFENTALKLYQTDAALNKIELTQEASPGVYTLEAKTKTTYYTKYLDEQNHPRLSFLPMDKIKKAKKILAASQYQAFAKTYFTVEKWKTPKPLGHSLEIIPTTDLSTVKPEDEVEVEVLFYGAPLTMNEKDIPYITAYSDNFGQKDGFNLISYLVDGKARFRALSRGEWIIAVFHRKDVEKDGAMKDLYGKTRSVYHVATLTFHVR